MALAPHGSPADRGAADAYYSRTPDPHWYPNGTGKAPRIPSEEMTRDQIREYLNAYDREDDRKNWL